MLGLVAVACFIHPLLPKITSQSHYGGPSYTCRLVDNGRFQGRRTLIQGQFILVF